MPSPDNATLQHTFLLTIFVREQHIVNYTKLSLTEECIPIWEKD